MTVTEDRPTNQQTQAAGRVVRVTGPVVDVEFPRDAMPDLFNALIVRKSASARSCCSRCPTSPPTSRSSWAGTAAS